MGNCITVRKERTWVDDEENSESSERQNLLMREEHRMMEVKIRIKKKQLEELLMNKRLSREKVLEEMLRRKAAYHENIREGHWKPRLQSIPEILDERCQPTVSPTKPLLCPPPTTATLRLPPPLNLTPTPPPPPPTRTTPLTLRRLSLHLTNPIPTPTTPTRTTSSIHLLNPPPSFVTFDYSLPSPLGLPAQNQLRTLFIAGLPDDTKPREIYNLFREFPGYESSNVRVKNGSSQAFAFAVFADQHSALTALHAYNGMKFDLERDSVLHIELAKSNSKGKRSRGDDDASFPHNATKYSRGEEEFGVGSNVHTSGHALHSLSGYPSAPRLSSLEPPPPPGTDYKKLELRSTGAPQENPPCPTLYVTNLGPTCTEDELAQVLSRWPGFLKLKLQRRHGPSAAFVDFKDEESATAALINLQGTLLHSSTEGMRLEYAKSRMGTRKHDRR